VSEERRDQPSADAPIAAGPQPTPAVTPEAPPAAGRVFDPETRALVAAVLDRLVPPRDDLSGAGGLDVGSFLERTLAGDAALRRLFLDGLRTIEIAAGAPFGSLDGARQDAVLRLVEAERPAFFAALVNHTYRGYYTNRQVLRGLEAAHGYAARPPQPLGHDLPPWDPALLARQRERAPFWRKSG
jgi:hypothetical protein